jgi:hypothetical protein
MGFTLYALSMPRRTSQRCFNVWERVLCQRWRLEKAWSRDRKQDFLMKNCLSCGAENREQAQFCGHCGRSFPTDALEQARGQRQLTEKHLNVAGWLTVIDAVVGVPLWIIESALSMSEYAGIRASGTFLSLISLGLLVYILSTFKQLLNSLFNFHGTDTLILVLIWASIISTVLSVSRS